MTTNTKLTKESFIFDTNNNLQKIEGYSSECYNQSDNNGYTPLCFAIFSHNFNSDQIKSIINFISLPSDKLSDPCARGKTALQYAMLSHNTDVVNILINDHNVSVSIDDLFIAAQLNIDSLLNTENLEQHILEKDAYGNTLLMIAVITQNYSLVDSLLKVPDIDVTIKNDSGKTAYMLANANQDTGIKDKLINYVKNINIDKLSTDFKEILDCELCEYLQTPTDETVRSIVDNYSSKRDNLILSLFNYGKNSKLSPSQIIAIQNYSPKPTTDWPAALTKPK